MRRGVVTHTGIDSLNFVILFIMGVLHFLKKYCIKILLILIRGFVFFSYSLESCVPGEYVSYLTLILATIE